MEPMGHKPFIDAIPDDIKVMILNCLGPVAADVTGKVDKIWQQFANKPTFWLLAANKLDIKVDQKNPKEGVLEYLQYHPINEAFKNLVVDEAVSKDVFARQFLESKSEREKYNALVNHFKSFKNEESPFLKYLEKVFENEPTPAQLRILKKLLEDDVLQEPLLFRRALLLTTEHNLETFSLIVDKAKALSERVFILTEALKAAADEGPVITPYLQILLRNGAVPNDEALAQAAGSIDFDQLEGAKHLHLLLDYSTAEMRQEAIEYLNRIEKREVDLADDDDRENIQKSFSNKRSIVQNAPAPTYGGQLLKNESQKK